MAHLSQLSGDKLMKDLRGNAGHPKPAWGAGETWRYYYLRECCRRGQKLLDELSWLNAPDASYRNIHTKTVEPLLEIATFYQFGRESSDPIGEQVSTIVEHWEPVEIQDNVGVV